MSTILNYEKWKMLKEQAPQTAPKVDMTPKTYLKGGQPAQGKIAYSISSSESRTSLNLSTLFNGTVKRLELSDTQLQNANFSNIKLDPKTQAKSAKNQLTSRKLSGDDSPVDYGYNTAAEALGEFLSYISSQGSEYSAGVEFAKFWEQIGTSELKNQIPPGVKKEIDNLFKVDKSQLASIKFTNEVSNVVNFKNGMDSMKKNMTVLPA